MSTLSQPATEAGRRYQLSLAAGMAAGPLFLLVSLAQLPVNDGIDLTRHAFSFLALGPHGWVQQLNFVVAGLLFAAASVSVATAVDGRLGRAAGVLMVLLGSGKIVSGLFPPDPSLGYPPGAPAGVPEDLSAGSVIHGVAFGMSVLAWVALLASLAWWLRRRGDHRWAGATALFAVALLLVPATSATSVNGLVIYVVVGSGYLFMTVMLHHLGGGISQRAEPGRRAPHGNAV